MSLYDDLVGESTTEKVAGWSSGIKLLQSQMQLFKKTAKKSETPKRPLVPSINNVNEVRYRKIEDSFQNETTQLTRQAFCSASSVPTIVSQSNAAKIHNEWSIADEYNADRPNDYEKVLKELRDLSREREKRRKRKNRFNESTDAGSGSEFDDSDRNVKRLSTASSKSSRSPKRESSSTNSFTMPSMPSSAPISAVAAKIMAKYGFKEGQGLGRQEQGIASALQVEKVSKTCGRIIQPGLEMPPPSSLQPPKSDQPQFVVPPPPPAEVNITEIMKKPSKVIMLRNMVGPGEVDAELEPEVREECNGKYGEVVRVYIRELKNVVDEEAVRIFVEFKRIESAIKAVVDLNGRFFGGRNVKAIFYDLESFDAGDFMQGAPKSSI